MGDTVRERILVVQLNIHFYKGFRAAVRVRAVRSTADGHNASVFRAALVYEFRLGKGWTLAPDLAVDFVSGGRVVYGYGLGVGHEF